MKSILAVNGPYIVIIFVTNPLGKFTIKKNFYPLLFNGNHCVLITGNFFITYGKSKMRFNDSFNDCLSYICLFDFIWKGSFHKGTQIWRKAIIIVLDIELQWVVIEFEWSCFDVTFDLFFFFFFAVWMIRSESDSFCISLSL